jgi:cell division protein FtsI/penicillin-binding protein 2
MGARFFAVIAFFGFAYAFLLFHFSQLQLNNGGNLARADGPHAAAVARGRIVAYDRDGAEVPLAIVKEFPIIYAAPKDIADPAAAARKVAPIIGMSVSELARRLDKPESAWEPLVKKAPENMAAAVEALELKGIGVKKEDRRYYPLGAVASHLLGYVGPDSKSTVNSGHYGVEEYYDAPLAGKGSIFEYGLSARTTGEMIELTIDPNIQVEAERILEEMVRRHGAKGGNVIVAEPKTGKILAMGSYPEFDPNSYNTVDDVGVLLNPVTAALYEPGSVVKVLTMASALDAGKVSPGDTFYDSGKLEVSGRTIYNWDMKGHGNVTMSNIIEKSLNTGAAYVQRQIGKDAFRDYIRKFGFGGSTGIDLPGELEGDLRALMRKDAPDIAFAAASFGQGIAVTPLQLLQAVGAIANGGTLMRPYVNRQLEPKEIREVISKRAADQITQMMISAVDKAEVAAVKGYSLAGKTGTAQIPDLKNGGYSDRVINTYVGFGPTSDPRFIILFKLNAPEGAPLAGLTVVPAFRDLAEFMINYLGIAPDRLETSR